MPLIRVLKVGTPGALRFWLTLVIGVVFISSEGVRGHAPPRPMYYGHRVEPREPFKHIPSALVFGVDSTPTRERLYDVMPTCGQLRNMWKSSLKNFNQNHINNNNLDSNEIPVILNNPYYMAFLYGLHESRPHFGKIISKPTPVTHSPLFEDRLQPHRNGKGFTQKSSVREAEDVAPIPGHFSDTPAVFGHPIYSPEEAKPDKNYRYHESGRFGEFVGQASEDSNESNSKSSDKSKDDRGGERGGDRGGERGGERGTAGVKQQRTTGNGFSSADDFFKSGVWSDQPVIPSVSFQRFH